MMNKSQIEEGDRPDVLKDSTFHQKLDKETLKTLLNRVYNLINAIEQENLKDPRARGLYLLVFDIKEAIDQELTHSDLLDFGFYPKRFPEFWLL